MGCGKVSHSYSSLSHLRDLNCLLASQPPRATWLALGQTSAPFALPKPSMPTASTFLFLLVTDVQAESIKKIHWVLRIPPRPEGRELLQIENQACVKQPV